MSPQGAAKKQSPVKPHMHADNQQQVDASAAGLFQRYNSASVLAVLLQTPCGTVTDPCPTVSNQAVCDSDAERLKALRSKYVTTT